MMTQQSFEENLVGWLLRRTSPSGVRRVAELPIALASNVGLTRDENQDRVVTLRFQGPSRQQFSLVVLSDGMGGMADGASCAALAIASFCNFVIQGVETCQSRELLYNAALYANSRVHDTYHGSGGATLSSILMVPGPENAYWVNVGDSRIYSYGEKRTVQITTDDTLAGQLARDSSGYFGRSELLQFIGIGEIAEPHIGILESRDRASMYVLSSDGVHFLPIDVIQQILAHASEPAIAARRLTDLALWCGGHDNASLATVSTIREYWQSLPITPIDVVEIWDPFGDARFFGVKSTAIRHEGGHEVLHPAAVISGARMPRSELGESRQPDVPGNSAVPVSSITGATKRPVKRKKTTKKKNTDSPTVAENVAIPKLMINFLKKEDKR